jgi:hypothetical protein
MYVATCATLMNHGSMIFLMALFTLAWLKTKPDRSWVWPIVAGFVLGYGFNARPQTAVGFGIPFAIWSLVKLVGKDRGREAPRQLAMLAAFVAPFLFTLHYNKVVTGQYLLFPLQYYSNLNENVFDFGFTEIGRGDYTHTPAAGAANLLLNAMRMNLWLFGWPFSLLFVFLFVLRGRFSAGDRLLLGVIASMCVVHLPFLSPGVLEVGPRFYFTLMIPLSLLTARGMIGAREIMIEAFASRPAFRSTAIVPVFVAFSILLAGTTFYPEQAARYMSLTESIASPYRAVERAGLHNAIVRIDALPAGGWVRNPRNNRPDFSDDIIYARGGRPDALLELLNAHPQRSVHTLTYETRPEGPRPQVAPLSRENIERAAAVFAIPR